MSLKQKSLPTKRLRIALIIAVMTGVLFAWHKEATSGHSQAAEPIEQKELSASVDLQTAEAAAIGAEGYGILATGGDQNRRPIASIAKVITALALLEKHPLNPGESGPSIPITEADEQLYRDYVAKNGTVVLIKAGVPITLHDALEAMLLPSANNVADTAVIWAFGSLEAYHQHANNMLWRFGLHHTTVGGDASGLSPLTQSTASDLVKLGEIALKNPVIAQIVASGSAEIPFAGPIPNYNSLVTDYGFNGIKPGDSIEAGITMLFSTKQTINNKEVTLIGTVLGAQTYQDVNDQAVALVNSVISTQP
jgi:D-alanyl-D-alanine carboxypeptidase (penicillin-binding protein 5/6)